jgi:hypothetical protein
VAPTGTERLTLLNNGNFGIGAIAPSANLQVTGNAYVSKALETTNVFVSNGLDVGPGTLGTNVVVFSNISGGANTFVMDSNGRVSIGAGTQGGGSLLSFGQLASTNKIITLYDSVNSDDPVTTTNFVGFGRNINALRYQVPSSITDRHVFYGGSSELARITSTGVSILTGANPTSNLQVTGNAYISNAVTTTNVFAVTATVPGFTSQFTVNGGGTVTWSAAGYLFWDTRVIVIPAWRNAAYATGGYWDINCPATGNIVSNGGTVTCTGAGIPVGGWAALYYRVVPGTSQASVQANFLLKDYTDTTYSPDSNWILLAVRNGTTNELKWMPGNTTIPLGGTFYTPSASFDKVQVAGTVVVDSTRSASFLNVFSSNALTTTNVFANTLTMSNATSTINVIGSVTATTFYGAVAGANTGAFSNLYSANSVTTTNIFAAGFTSNAANTVFNFDTLTIPFMSSTTLNVATVANVSALVGGDNTLFANLFVSNSVTATNLFASSGLDVGPGVLGTNVFVFSNAYGLSNVMVMNSLGRVGLGTTNPGSLLSFGQPVLNKIVTLWDGNAGDNPSSATNFYGLGINNSILRYQVDSTSARHTFYGGSSEYARFTNLGLSILTGANPTANLHVQGNIFASNALQTATVVATTANVTTLNTASIFGTNLNITSTSNLSTTNVTTLNAVSIYATSINFAATGFDTANIKLLNVWQISNLYNLDLLSTLSVPTANIQTLNVSTPILASSGLYMNLNATYSLNGTGNWYGNIASTWTSNLYTLFAPNPTASWTKYGSNPFVSGPSTNGSFKFSQSGPWAFTAVITSDNNIKTLALSSNTSDIHSNLADTNVWEYVYRIGVGQDPSIPITIPFFVNDPNKYYFLDIETANQTDNIHRTRYTNTAAEAYTGSYVILKPV